MLDLQKIEEISKGIDEHLRKLEGMMSLMREIKASLDELRHAQERTYMFEVQKMRMDVNDLSTQLVKHGLQQSDRYAKEFQELRAVLDGAAWPVAVSPEAICDTDEKAAERAGSILDILVGEHLKDKSFLDYGCGRGDTIPEAKRREARVAVGYDVDLSKTPFDLTKFDFASDFRVVKSRAPFDIILLHDVLDHAVVIDPLQILLQVKSVLAPKGRVYVRTHPWTARHGGHLYLQRNKAFLHLVMDAVELSRVGGLQCEHNIKVSSPLETYRHWFAETGFRVVSETPIRDKVETFFLHPSLVHERLMRLFPGPDMVNHLEISFVEYVLEATGGSQDQII